MSEVEELCWFVLPLFLLSIYVVLGIKASSSIPCLFRVDVKFISYLTTQALFFHSRDILWPHQPASTDEEMKGLA